MRKSISQISFSFVALVLCTPLVGFGQSETPPQTPVLTLAQAQEAAVDHNFDLRIAAERLERAEILTKKAWALILPVISAQGQIVRNNIEISFTPPFPGATPIEIQRLYQKNASASFSWALLNGRSIPLIRNAYTSVEIAQISHEQAKSLMRYSTALAYYNVLNAQRQVDIRRRSLANKQEHLRLDRARFQVGDATEVTTLRSEVEVAGEEQALIRSQNAASIARHALSTLMGRPNHEEIGGAAEFVAVPPNASANAPSQDLVASALQQRLDLKTRLLEIEVAERYKTETWMKFLPVLAATGSYQWNEAAGFAGQNTTWQLGLALNWTLFEGGLTFWELGERSHDINIAVINHEKTRFEIAQQVEEARLNLESANATYTAAKRRAELAQRTAKLVDAQYAVGAATQLDAMDATRALADAETAESLAQLAVEVSKLTLEQTLIAPPSGAGMAASSSSGTMASQQTGGGN